VSLALFVSAGFRGTSVRDIADEVGVTQPTLYYHFGSKDGILSALIQPLMDAGDALLDELAPHEAGSRALATRALEGYYDLIAGHLDLFLLVESDRSVRSHPEAGRRLAEQAARFLEILASSSDRHDRLAAAAAIGAVRRPLRLFDIDPIEDRSAILACAQAALHAG